MRLLCDCTGHAPAFRAPLGRGLKIISAVGAQAGRFKIARFDQTVRFAGRAIGLLMKNQLGFIHQPSVTEHIDVSLGLMRREFSPILQRASLGRQ